MANAAALFSKLPYAFSQDVEEQGILFENAVKKRRVMTDIVGNRTLRSQWDETVHCYGESIFLEFISKQDEWCSFTYAAFDAKVKQCTNLLLSLGVQPGELIALHMHNTPQYLVAWLAIAQVGAVSVPLNEHYQLRESAYVLQKCGITKLIAEPAVLGMYVENREALGLETLLLAIGATNLPGVIAMEEAMGAQSIALAEVRPVGSDDMAVLLFTSGTTSKPKGAIYTHANVVYGGLLHADQIHMNRGDRFLTAMPCYHMDFQEMAAMPVICTGSTLLMVEKYSARRFWRQIYEYKAHFTDTMSVMNRTMMLQPVQSWEKKHCLKQIYFSMGLSNEEKKQFESRFNVQLLNSYGMTETVTAVTCAPLTGDKHWPSVGRASLSYKVKITDKNGEEVPPGTVGEICIHGVPGRTLVPGYYREPEATARLLDRDGWLHSGDKGYLDEDGFLYFVDRSGNIIKRSGENVSSSEVENVLTSHEGIADAAVIGVPDAIRGEAVKAFVQLVSGARLTEEEIISYCGPRLAKFKIPACVQFVDDFPRTSTGKIKKEVLRQALG